MKIKIFYFTQKGYETSERIKSFWNTAQIMERKKVLKDDFTDADLLIFVGACGIALRLIAPYIEDKLKDPAVLVVDELASFVIPVLSGHVGGANGYAEELASFLKAIPVITTATDINNIIAVDELSSANNLKIVNRDNIKKVSSGLLKGRPINISLGDDVIITSSDSKIDDEVLGLVYQPIVVGLGMRKNIDFSSLETFFLTNLSKVQVNVSDVAGIASIDIKKDEEALSMLCQKYNIPSFFYTADELKAVEGEFSESAFVEKTVGVSDVSQRAAKALGMNGTFILDKYKQDGMTISIFKKLRRITFEY